MWSSRFRARAVIFGAALAPLAALGCAGGDRSDAAASSAAAATAASLLDVDDVSILFGFTPSTTGGIDNPPKGGVPIPEITLDAHLANGMQLISTAQFAQLTTFADGQGVSFFGNDDLTRWRLVSLRADPCSPGLDSRQVQGDRSKCQVQVRLVAEPLNDVITTDDFAMHLVYTLGTLDKVDVESVLRAPLARIAAQSAADGHATAGQPLGVHPALAASDERVEALVRAFVASLEPVAMKVTLSGTIRGAGNVWAMLGGVMVNAKNPSDLANASFVPLSRVPASSGGGMANLPARTDVEVFTPGFEPFFDPTPIDKTRSMAPIFARGEDKGNATAFGIEDPSKANAVDTDCSSCHATSSRTIVLKAPSSPARVRVPAGITGYAPSAVQQRSDWNIRNFGYRTATGSVSFRTVNETVAVLRILNGPHLPPPSATNGVQFFGPGNDCTKSDDAVWNCFATSQDGSTGCLSACTPFPIARTPGAEP